MQFRQAEVNARRTGTVQPCSGLQVWHGPVILSDPPCDITARARRGRGRFCGPGGLRSRCGEAPQSDGCFLDFPATNAAGPREPERIPRGGGAGSALAVSRG